MSQDENTNTTKAIKKKWYKRKGIVIPLLILIVIGIATSGDEDESSSTSGDTTASTEALSDTSAPEASTTTTTTSTTTIVDLRPDQQVSFITAIENGRAELDAATTDLQRSKALRDRDRALCDLLENYVATDWVGTIERIGANGEGKAYLTLEIGEDARVQTWNNAFSDIGDNTLIPENSEVFAVIVPLTEGDRVRFSATFLKGSDTCLKAGNFTETFYGIDPEFIVRFTQVSVVEE